MLHLISIVLTLFIWSNGDNNNNKDSYQEPLELKINASKTKQTIHSFGASDAWSCQFIGNWPDQKKNQIADWLFSKGLDSIGNPLGIGLSCWRFNIGAGSTEQGTESGIKDEWRRAESFMTDTKQYNWNNLQGQRWFLRAAKEREVEQFIGFVNSPPVHLSRNGKAFSSNKLQYNLAPNKYLEFSNYLSSIVTNIAKKEGVYFDYISPVNEPQWDWTNGNQEGSPAQNSEIAELCKAIDKEFNAKGIRSKLEIAESGQLNYLYANDNRSGRGEHIKTFFDPASSHYIGDLKSVAKKIAGHSYYTTWPIERQIDVRENVTKAIEALPEPIEFWMSEYCILENNPEIKGGKRDLSMKTALYVSRLIYSDLVLANASSWQWWLAISPYNYKDGLIYTDKDKTDGKYYDSKLLWSLGNFSRFIRPGMKRVEVSRNDDLSTKQTLNNLMATAFVSDDKSNLSVVLVNPLEKEVPLNINLNDFKGLKELKIYVTNRDNNLSYQGRYNSTELYTISARSVVTITTY